MIHRDLWHLAHPDFPEAANVGTRAQCEEWRDRDPCRRPADTYSLWEAPICGVCGDTMGYLGGTAKSAATYPNGSTRCDAHWDRNCCAIEGCKRHTAAPTSDGIFHAIADDQWLCADHWRRYVPARSDARRAYHRYFRRAKRLGWTPELETKFKRFWGLLIAQARRRATGGYVDEREIARIMGWD